MVNTCLQFILIQIAFLYPLPVFARLASHTTRGRAIPNETWEKNQVKKSLIPRSDIRKSHERKVKSLIRYRSQAVRDYYDDSSRTRELRQKTDEQMSHASPRRTPQPQDDSEFWDQFFLPWRDENFSMSAAPVSVAPSTEPTSRRNEPSHYPSIIPTVVPTSLPSDKPSILPSQIPSVLILQSPSKQPSVESSNSPTVPPNLEGCDILDFIKSNALINGNEFDSPFSYQNYALAWLCSSNTTAMTEARLLQRYALACFYFATYAVSSPYTGTEVDGWIQDGGWLSDTDECTWARIGCEEKSGMINIIDQVRYPTVRVMEKKIE